MTVFFLMAQMLHTMLHQATVQLGPALPLLPGFCRCPSTKHRPRSTRLLTGDLKGNLHGATLLPELQPWIARALGHLG